MKTKIIAHIDMDAFFAAVEQRDNPTLLGKPVIIGADPKGGLGRGVVSTCSYEARKFGIHSAMPISMAYRRCPNGIFLRGSMYKYKKVSEQIFNILYDFTPEMEPVSVDEAFLDLTGSCHLFGGAHKTGLRIKERIREKLSLNASVGIAPIKMAAKIASDLCKPNGLMEITQTDLIAFLHPLAVEKLWGVGKQTKNVLNAMGMRTIGDIASFPVEILRNRLGVHGEHLFNLANGVDGREVYTDDEIKSVSHEHTFDRDVSQVSEVYKILSRLSEKVSRRLRKYELKGKTLSLKIRLSDFKTVTRAHTFGERLNFFDDIYNASRAVFDEFYESGMRVRLIGVRMSNFDDPYIQENLFVNDLWHQKRENVHRVMDKIKDKFGENAIKRATGLN